MSLAADTNPEVERIWLGMLRSVPSWRKMQMVGEMSRAVRLLMLAGLRQRYPHESEERLRRRLAGMLLGEDLASKAYGPLSPEDALDE